jgi:hypothetical protein
LKSAFLFLFALDVILAIFNLFSASGSVFNTRQTRNIKFFFSLRSLRVRVLLKPRGFGVQWKQIVGGEHIRVTDRGKPLVLEIASDSASDLNWDSLELNLLDCNSGTQFRLQKGEESRAWQLDDKKHPDDNTPSKRQFSVRVFLRPACICVCAIVKTSAGDIVEGKSAAFYSSNTGRPKPPKTAVSHNNILSGLDGDASQQAHAPLAPPPQPRDEVIINANLSVNGHLAAKHCAFF